MSKGVYNILMKRDPNIDFLRRVKIGDLIKIELEHDDCMLVLVKSISLNEWGDQWHRIDYYLFFRTHTHQFATDNYCGCVGAYHACRPTLDDYILFQEKMKIYNASFNRKKVKEENKQQPTLNKYLQLKWT